MTTDYTRAKYGPMELTHGPTEHDAHCAFIESRAKCSCSLFWRRVCATLQHQLEAEREKRQAAESEWEAALCKALDERNVATLRLEAAEERLRAAEDWFELYGGNVRDLLGEFLKSYEATGTQSDARQRMTAARDGIVAIHAKGRATKATDTSTGGAGEGVP